MAELEVPPPDLRRRHDLRSLDAHSEATARRRSAVIDRRLAGRRPHRGRRPLRRRRGRRQGQADCGGAAAGGPGRDAGPSTPQAATPSPRQRNHARAAGDRCAAGARSQTRADLRRIATPAAQASGGVSRPRGRARTARRSCAGDGAVPRGGGVPNHGIDGQPRRPDRGPPKTQAALETGPSRPGRRALRGIR